MSLLPATKQGQEEQRTEQGGLGKAGVEDTLRPVFVLLTQLEKRGEVFITGLTEQ